MSQAEINELVALRAENARLKAQATASVRVKMSDKGAIMITGIGKWPTTLYREQWIKVFGVREQVEALYPQCKAKDETTLKAVG